MRKRRAEKDLLEAHEILDLDSNLIEIYTYFRRLRDRSDVAQLIHYPSIPAALSESLTVHCASVFFGESWTARLGAKRADADVILVTPEGELKVEVKSTGQTNFQEFKSKDLDLSLDKNILSRLNAVKIAEKG
jgi:hypothetical protein